MGKGSSSKFGVAAGGLARLGRAVAGVTTAALLVGLVGGLIIGENALAARAAELRALNFRQADVQILWPADREDRTRVAVWMSRSIRDNLLTVARSAVDANPLDAAGLERVANELRRTGWFMTGPVARREPGGRVIISGGWRAPVAVVRWQERDHLVSAGGERLQLSYPIGTAMSAGLRAIVGASEPPPEGYGDEWTGGDVDAAIALLAYLQQDREVYAQVTAIDVSRYVPGNRRHLIVQTREGRRVLWGSPPPSVTGTEFKPGEPSATTKMNNLRVVLFNPEVRKRLGVVPAGAMDLSPLIDLTNPVAPMIDRSANAIGI